MTDEPDRRTVLKGVAASAFAFGGFGEAFAAEGLQYDEPQPFSYDLFKARARATAHPPRARCGAEDQLRGMGQDQVSYRGRAVRRRSGPFPGELLPSRPVLS